MPNLNNLFLDTDNPIREFILSKCELDFNNKHNASFDNIPDLCNSILDAISVFPDVKVRQYCLEKSDIKLKLKFRFLNGVVVFPKLNGFNYTAHDGSPVYPTFQEFIDFVEDTEINSADKPIVQHLMDLSRTFRSTPSDLYDHTYKHLEREIYRALCSKSKGTDFLPKDLSFE